MNETKFRMWVPGALLLLALSGCVPGSTSPGESPSSEASTETSGAGSSVTVSVACSDAMAAAAAVEDISDAVADVIRACDTLAEWVAASDLHPEALDGASPKLSVQNACASLPALQDEPLCVEVGAPGS